MLVACLAVSTTAAGAEKSKADKSKAAKKTNKSKKAKADKKKESATEETDEGSESKAAAGKSTGDWGLQGGYLGVGGGFFSENSHREGEQVRLSPSVAARIDPPARFLPASHFARCLGATGLEILLR